jgi:hypothetical protein
MAMVWALDYKDKLDSRVAHISWNVAAKMTIISTEDIRET